LAPGSNPITNVGTDIGSTEKYLKANSYSAILATLLGLFGKNLEGEIGVIKTFNETKPF